MSDPEICSALHLQLLLGRLGASYLLLDGRIDSATADAVRTYQHSSGLVPDGVAGPITRAALTADALARSLAERFDAFDGFRGSLGLLVQWEGHAGAPYVPTGPHSGLTLDPGFDLRFHHAGELRALYRNVFTAKQLGVLAGACGLKNADARAFCAQLEPGAFAIGRTAAALVLPRIAAPYWDAVLSVTQHVVLAPPAVQSALLSLAYNAGPDDLEPLRGMLTRKDWHLLPAAFAAIPKVQARREAEADLIAWALGSRTEPGLLA